MAAKVVTDASFDEEVTGAAGPVLVDFWAPWCGPCRFISPALEEIGSELDGRLTVVKVNVDENPESAGRFGVRGIPTLILFKDGETASVKVGAASKGALREWIDATLQALDRSSAASGALA